MRKRKCKIADKVGNNQTNGIKTNPKCFKSIKVQDKIQVTSKLNMESIMKNIPLELSDSDNSISTIREKKKFGKPVIISSDINKIQSIPIPNVLRICKQSKLTENENNVLPNNISECDVKKSTSIITVNASNNASSISYKEKITKSPKAKVSDGINESIDLDKRPLTSIHNDSLENLDEGPLSHFYSLRNKVICVLEPQCKFSFHGKLKIKVLYGGVKMYGATVNKSNTVTPIEVYSSRDNNLISIQSTKLENYLDDDLSSVWKVLKKDNIDCNISNALQSNVNNVKEGWAIIILENLENNLTKFLEINCNYKLFPKIDNVSNYYWSDIKRAEIVLQTNIYCDKLTKQTINFNGLDEIIDKILIKCTNNKNTRVLMAGGKNVGKSTTMRYLINRILEQTDRVIVLDLDPGQSEFTLPGCISLNIVKDRLFGSNFTHLKRPYYQFYIGGVDVSRYLSNYINGVKKLAEQLNEYLNTIQLPVIVNTMGFCRGIGWHIITRIIKCIQPTDIIQIISQRSKNNFDQLLNHDIINSQININWENILESNTSPSSNEYELHIINSRAEVRNAIGEMWNIEPHQQREIVTLAYLSEINKPQAKSNSYNSNIARSINAIIPYQVPFSAVKLSLGHSTTPLVLSVMNGNIVALCGCNVDYDQDESFETNSLFYPEVLIRLPLSTCYGFGIVRGVDMDKKYIYINTPLSSCELKYVNCLVGCIPVPSGLLQLKRFGVPYTGGGDCNLPTTRDPRRGYFRMKYRGDT